MITLSQEELVPGDVVALSRGLVYTDLVLISAEHLLVDESALTVSSESKSVFLNYGYFNFCQF